MKQQPKIQLHHTAPPMSMTDVLQAVEHCEGLSAAKRRDLRSAIKTFANWTNLPLDAIPATRKELRRHFEKLNPVLVGVSKGRFANVRSAINTALDLAGAPNVRRNQPISEEWRAIVDRARTLADKNSLSPFGRYCTGIGISPDRVEAKISDGFLWHLENQTMVSGPRQKHQILTRAWNRIVEGTEDLELNRLEVPKYRDGFGLPRDLFPQSLRNDIESYAAYLGNSDVLSDQAPVKPLRPKTISQRIKQLYAAASALVASGIAIEEITDLAFLIRVENVERVLRFYYERHDGKKTKVLSDVAEGLFKVAFRFVGVDEARLEKLREFKKSTKMKMVGMTDKNRKALRFFNDPDKVAQLKAMPFDEFKRIETELRNYQQSLDGNIAPNKLAIAYQMALVVLILQNAPMRVGNLRGLRLDQHLNWKIAPGKLLIEFPADEVKNDEPLIFELPEHVTFHVRRYIDVYRPALLRGENLHLFPGENGKAKSENNLSQQIAKMAERKLGVRLTAHQWRHVMGKLYLDSNPGKYEVLRRVLGHKAIETTMAYYAGEETTSALRHYQQSIMEAIDDIPVPGGKPSQSRCKESTKGKRVRWRKRT